MPYQTPYRTRFSSVQWLSHLAPCGFKATTEDTASRISPLGHPHLKLSISRTQCSAAHKPAPCPSIPYIWGPSTQFIRLEAWGHPIPYSPAPPKTSLKAFGPHLLQGPGVYPLGSICLCPQWSSRSFLSLVHTPEHLLGSCFPRGTVSLEAMHF